MNEAMMIKAKEAKTAAELMELAKAENIEMTEEKAQKFFTRLHAEGELSDNELDDVAGGGCGETGPKYKDGDIVALRIGSCPVPSPYGPCPGCLFKVLRRYGDGYEIMCTSCCGMSIVTENDISGRIQ